MLDYFSSAVRSLLASSSDASTGGPAAPVARLRSRVEDLQRRLTESKKALSKAENNLQGARKDRADAYRRLRSIVDSTGDSICAIAGDYTLLLFNEAYARAFEERFGYPPEEGMSLMDVFQEDSVEREMMRRWWQRALGGEAYELLRTVSPGGDEDRFYDVRFTPIVDENGEQIGAVSVTREVTAVKRAEEQVRRTNEELEQANRRLEESNRILERRNEELQEFTMIASHDLREPIRKVSTFADLLLEGHGEKVDDEGRLFLERLDQAAHRMMSLLDSLLVFSRVRSEANPVEEVHLTQAAHAARLKLDGAVRDSRAHVEIEPLPTITADPFQMEQMFEILIDNAVKFRRETEPCRITIRGRETTGPDGDAVARLEISDNGIGFDESYLERIFSPFERLHGREHYKGAGMGLAICRRIVEQHGGRISGTSTVGAGATFIVELPCRRRTPA